MTAPGLAARGAAAALLAGVLEKGRTLSEQTDAPGGPLTALPPGERARAQALATGTLRHLGRIDAVIGRFLQKPPPPPALNALRLAVAELNLDGVPAHAAVDGAVRLAGAGKGRHLKGMVNAVARRVAEGGTALWEAAPEAPLPDWLAGPIADAWGAPALAAITEAHRRGAAIDLTPKDPDTAPGWAAGLGADRLPTGSLRLPARARVSGLPGYEEGAWWVQDAAAALPVRLFGELRGKRALDVCAAPGGKTLQLAALGAAVTALDLSETRLARLRENLARTGLSAQVMAGDALAWTPEARFDAVLVDAPCSATGTIRRHPDLPHLGTRRDLAPLLALQAALLARAWDWLAPDGQLVYCVCSLFPAEGEEQLAHFLAATPEARTVPPDPAALGIAPGWIDATGGLRLRPDFWPERGGMDGFYAVCLAKPGDAA